MSHQKNSRTPRPIRFLFENSLFLIFGAVAALIWANVHTESYEYFIHFNPTHGEAHDVAHGAHDAGHATSVQPAVEHSSENVGEAIHAAGADGKKAAGGHGLIVFLVNDLLMALFFAIAGKEVWESILPGGALSNPKKAATPLLATVGGIVGPAAVYLVGCVLVDQWNTLHNGWAVPCATDIAFSYLVARIIFGTGSPAIAFLLLLAIADDAAGLVILAVFFPSKAIVIQWLGLTVAAIALGYGMRKMRLQSFWWYLLGPGVLSWTSFYLAGIHPALGLVPIIPTMPHAHTDLGIFAQKERGREDTLNEFEHWWKNPVELVLGLFGLVNAGVVLNNFAAGTWLVLAGLIIGKTFGILFFTWVAVRWMKMEMPSGMTYRHVATLGMVAAIGFTVALFVSVAAFKTAPTAILDSVKMGALLSFAAAPLAYLLAKILNVKPVSAEEAGGIEYATSTSPDGESGDQSLDGPEVALSESVGG
ncbi:MAG: Na+/H+ antiporter NhaA [Pirellulaceae bacterium]|jgi:NhaA family Na+:H+ antiporter|nr:Na+/H+ antiporter NhaA [Pirellulaceae bacterium]